MKALKARERNEKVWQQIKEKEKDKEQRLKKKMKGLKEKQQVSMVTPERKGEELYKVVELLGLRKRKPKGSNTLISEVHVLWEGNEKTWEPEEIIRETHAEELNNLCTKVEKNNNTYHAEELNNLCDKVEEKNNNTHQYKCQHHLAKSYRCELNPKYCKEGELLSLVKCGGKGCSKIFVDKKKNKNHYKPSGIMGIHICESNFVEPWIWCNHALCQNCYVSITE